MRDYIEVKQIPFGDKTLRSKNELSLVVLKDDNMLHCEDYSLRIDCYAYTMEELKRYIEEDIKISWKNYVLFDPNELTFEALYIRNTLLRIFEEI